MPTVTPTPFMEYSDISSIATAVTSTFDVATLTGLIAGALGRR